LDENTLLGVAAADTPWILRYDSRSISIPADPVKSTALGVSWQFYPWDELVADPPLALSTATKP